MPSTTPCVNCRTVGNVRWERVITGTVVLVEYYCGHCEHVWRVREDEERRDTPRPAPAGDGPGHVRPGQLPHTPEERTNAEDRRRVTRTDRRRTRLE